MQKVDGKPLIFFPIKSAIKSKVCDDIFVSTDDERIAKAGIKFGAQVPFLRKKTLNYFMNKIPLLGKFLRGVQKNLTSTEKMMLC